MYWLTLVTQPTVFFPEEKSSPLDPGSFMLIDMLIVLEHMSLLYFRNEEEENGPILPLKESCFRKSKKVIQLGFLFSGNEVTVSVCINYQHIMGSPATIFAHPTCPDQTSAAKNPELGPSTENNQCPSHEVARPSSPPALVRDNCSPVEI